MHLLSQIPLLGEKRREVGEGPLSPSEVGEGPLSPRAQDHTGMTNVSAGGPWRSPDPGLLKPVCMLVSTEQLAATGPGLTPGDLIELLCGEVLAQARNSSPGDSNVHPRRTSPVGTTLCFQLSNPRQGG